MALLVLAVDGCAFFEWWDLTDADEALARCRRTHVEPGSCSREAAAADERQREYDRAVERSACFEGLHDEHDDDPDSFSGR